VLMLLFFPSGRGLGGRWTWVERFLVLFVVVLVVANFLKDAPIVVPIENGQSLVFPNPFAAPGVLGQVMTALGHLGDSWSILIVLTGPLSLFVRYRRSSAIERQQIKWVVFAFGLALVGIGDVVANLMFDLSAVNVSHHDRSSGGLWLGEVVATFGLVVIIFGVVRAGQGRQVAYAVGGYITAAYWFTSSTSFANPAISIGRMLSDTFAGIAPGSVPVFVLMQLLGGVLATGAVLVLYPNAAQVADDLVDLAHLTPETAS